jgi:hypothetical protein
VISPRRHLSTRYNIDVENIRRSSMIAERRKPAGQVPCRIVEPYRVGGPDPDSGTGGFFKGAAAA